MRVNWLAILTSAIVFFLFGGLWFKGLGDPWATALGSTAAVMAASNAHAYPYAVAFVMGFFIAYGLARIILWRGDVNPFRGAIIGFSFALLIFGAGTWLDYAFEHRSIVLSLINVGYMAIGMAIQGAILSLWKPKSA